MNTQKFFAILLLPYALFVGGVAFLDGIELCGMDL